MAKKEVIWTKKAEIQMFTIMDYYAERNKSDVYSLKLKKAIDLKLSKINQPVSLPQKTSIENVFYFIQKHISIFFSIENNKIFVILAWDERRNPKDLLDILQSF